jgi:hypothetical protein
MVATDILDTFKRLGITAYVNGDKLIVEPGSKVPPELAPEIREHKANHGVAVEDCLYLQPTAQPDSVLGHGPGRVWSNV